MRTSHAVPEEVHDSHTLAEMHDGNNNNNTQQ